MVRNERKETSPSRPSRASCTSRSRTTRRRVLASVAGVGISSLLASVAPTAVAATDAESDGSASLDSASTDLVADSLDALSLGTFESGLDGWDATGATDLARVGRTDRPVAVTEGEHALEVAANGESSPAISRPVEALGLATHPYFVADVAPGRVEGTDAPVAFRFRLYRPSDLLDGDLELVAESEPVAVRQAAPGRIFWDASDVDASLLDAASVLEVAWSPVESDSADGTTEDFAYRGTVVFDAVRATDSVDAVGSARIAATMTELQFDHGPYERTEVTAESDVAEEGAFVFADGGTEPYRFEILAEDRFRLTIAETAVKLGGGWR